MIVRIFIFLVHRAHCRTDIGIAVAETGQGVESAPPALFIGKFAGEFGLKQIFYPLNIVAVELFGTFARRLARYSALSEFLFDALFAHAAPLIQLLREGVGIALVVDIAHLFKAFDRFARKLRAGAAGNLSLKLL